MQGRGRVVAALLAVWVLWGSTFLGIRVVVQSVPPLLAAGVRFALAGVLLLIGLCWWWRRRSLPGPRARLRGRTGRLALLGLLHFLCANGLVSVASEDLASGAAGTYFATVPIWVLLLRGRPGLGDLGAAALGLVGVGVLLGFETGPLAPSLLVLLAALLWAVAGRIAARPDGGSGPAPGAALSSAVQMICGGAGLLTASAIGGEWSRLRPAALAEPAVWLAQAHLVFLGSLVGFLAYVWLVGRVDQRLASTYSYVNPMVAVALGALVLSEELTLATLAGTVCLTAAVAWTVRTTTTGRPPGPRSRPPLPPVTTVDHSPSMSPVRSPR